MFDYIIIGGGISGLYNYIKLMEKDNKLKSNLCFSISIRYLKSSFHPKGVLVRKTSLVSNFQTFAF